MAFIKSKKEIEALREGGRKLADILQKVVEVVKPGVTTKELDRLAESLILSSSGTPSFKGYHILGARSSYPASLCTSINDEVVHGIPSEKRVLKKGDIIGLDIGMKFHGLYTDMAVTVGVGIIDAASRKLLTITEHALAEGIARVCVLSHVGDISEAIQTYAEDHELGVVRELVGHGVGHAVHENPPIPNFGRRGQGEKLREGMVIAIEPMLTAGDYAIVLAPDDWTWKTKDGSRAAHFEHTVVVTKDGAEVLTK